MGLAAWNASQQMLEDRATVLVGWDVITEADISEILKGIIQFMIRFITLLPKTISLREFLRTKRRQTQKII